MRVLIADDDADCRLILQMMLSKQGWEVDIATDGEEAVRLAGERAPGLVLMDLLMPELTGLQAVALMREQPALAQTKFLAITAMAFEQERAMALAGGFDAVVTKPFHRKQLLEAIRSVCPDQVADNKVPA